VLCLLHHHRLVTLIGAPGVGKSRLAREVADRVTPICPGGAVVVGLHSTPPGQVLRAVASALDVTTRTSSPHVDTVAGWLDDRRVLLLLDDCDRVVDDCAALAGLLVERCQGLRILATSRTPLGTAPEKSWRVPSLAVPHPEDDHRGPGFAAYEAVQLFLARYAAAAGGLVLSNDDARAVGEICRRLDGLPLGIELAARQGGERSPADIAAGLDDRFTLLRNGLRRPGHRHEDLESALAWSYDLLPGAEQALLRRASVFASGFTTAAVHAVCLAGEVTADRLPDLLDRLVSRSLVVGRDPTTGGRFRLLETIRYFARDRLVDSGEMEELERRHLAYCVALVTKAGDPFHGREWLERLAPEADDLEAALERADALGQVEAALRLAPAYALLCWAAADHGKAWEWPERMLSRTSQLPARFRVRALCDAGVVAGMVGELDTAAERLHAGAAVAESVGDFAGAARALNLLGFVSILGDDHGAGLAALDESLALARDADDDVALADALDVAGRAHMLAGHTVVAHRHLAESLALARRTGDPATTASGLVGTGWVAVVRGDYPEAASALSEGLSLATEIADVHTAAAALAWLGELARLRGDDAQARQRFEECAARAREAGVPHPLARALVGQARLARAAGDLDGAHRLFEEALSVVRANNLVHLVAPCLAGSSEVAQARGRLGTARDLAKEALGAARQCSDRGEEARAVFQLGRVACAGGDRRLAARLHREALCLSSEVEDLAGVADSLEALGGLAATAGRLCEAASILGAAQSVRDRHGLARRTGVGGSDESDLDVLRRSLGREAFATAWRQGAARSTDEATTYAAHRWPSLHPASQAAHRMIDAET